MGYQERDKEIIDYAMYELPGIKPYAGAGRFRGPQVRGKDYIACVGAAQTFGCLSQRPFPSLLAERLGIDTLNLGSGGAGPSFHNSNACLLQYINNARLVIVQVLSARSQSNSLFRTTHHGMEGIRVSDGQRMIAQEFYTGLIKDTPEKVEQVVAETRQHYVRAMVQLLEDIRPPKILFWFSVRTPEYEERLELPLWRLWGAFPQFVNRQMVEEIMKHSDDYVECVSKRGLPQPLFDKNGKPATITYCYTILRPETNTDTHNNYYPSPQMHEDAAQLLEPVCHRYF
jgi:hypothetical protein